MELTSDWYFPGFFKGNVLEAGGRIGVADSVSGGEVPFYDRYYLGGLYSMRGYKYRNVAPRDPYYGNPVYGGMVRMNRSVVIRIGLVRWNTASPSLKRTAVSAFVWPYFMTSVQCPDRPIPLVPDFDDDVGVGIRLNIPHLGPLRLDYGIPITHDKYQGSSGQFQFGVGYERPF